MHPGKIGIPLRQILREVYHLIRSFTARVTVYSKLPLKPNLA